MADISSGLLEVDGIVRQREELEKLLATDPKMEKRLQKVIRKVLMEVRKEVQKSITFKHGDPRQAYKAVKTAVYRQVLGGSVSILNKRNRSTQFSAYEPPRKLKPHQRGGNRVKRGDRTYQVMHYAGPDRAFILRFLNAGTDTRTAGTRGGKLSGNRDRIAPRNFFGNVSHEQMRNASAHLQQLIDDLIRQEFK